jgi:hypothetical protein
LDTRRLRCSYLIVSQRWKPEVKSPHPPNIEERDPAFNGAWDLGR